MNHHSSARTARRGQRYFLLHKPYGVLCQFTAEPGRACLKDWFPVEGMYPCGRLDADSEGLLVLSDDGAFQARIASPEGKLWKTYWVQVEGIPDERGLEALRRGVLLEGRPTLPAQAKVMEAPPLAERDPPVRFRKTVPTSWLEIKLREGRNRQVRRMTAAVGFPTLRLFRWAVGEFTAQGLGPGQWREIGPPEAKGLRPVSQAFPERRAVRTPESGTPTALPERETSRP